MTVNLTINGVTYAYPEPGDDDWGQAATSWAQGVTGGMLQKAGGNFSLTADANFGATYGLVSTYFKSRTSNIADAGAVRLARADTIAWRDQANAGNLLLAVNSSDLLTFDGTAIQNALSVTDTGRIDLTLAADVLSADIVAGSITNTYINGSAAIAYSKLNLTGAIVNADISASAAIAYSKLALTASIVNADISGSAAIAYSKLALTGAIVNADVSASAAIARSKLADGTADHVLINSGAGVMTSEAQLAISRGGTGQATAAAALTALSPLTTKGDILGYSTLNARVAVGADGTVLTANSANPTGLGWTSPLTNPMDGTGQLIYGGVAGATTKLAAGTSNYVLTAAGASAPVWGLLVNANVSASAAIVYSKLSLTDSILNADINSAAAIAYSKLNLSGSIVNADINGSAAIARSKLAAITASRAMVSDGSGFDAASTVTTTELQYLAGVTAPTGSGALVLGTAPTLSSPIFVTPTLGVASGTSIANALGLVGTPSYTFTGDLNTGMYSSAADTLDFSTAGSNRLSISSSGNATFAGDVQIDGGNIGIGIAPSSSNTIYSSSTSVNRLVLLGETSGTQRTVELHARATTSFVGCTSAHSFDLVGKNIAMISLGASNNYITTATDQSIKTEIGRYSSGTAYSYLKLGTGSSGLRLTNATDAADIFEVGNTGTVAMSGSAAGWKIGSGSTCSQFIDWTAYTPTFSAGFGTVTAIKFYYRVLGKTLDIQGSFTMGTVTTGTPTITMPAGYSLNETLSTAQKGIYGTFATLDTTEYNAANMAGVVMIIADVLNLSFASASSTAWDVNNVNGRWSTGNGLALFASLPID